MKLPAPLMPSPSARVMLSLLSAGLWTGLFPDASLGALAWVAFVPLLLACRRVSTWTGFGLGWLCGFVASLGTYYWLFQVPGFGWWQALPLAAFLGMYPGVWGAAAARLSTGPPGHWLALPGLWVVLQWIKHHAGFLASPWATLAHSQHDNLWLLQFAGYTGEYGVGFVVVSMNVLVADALAGRRLRPRHCIGVVLVIAVHGFGWWTMQDPGPPTDLRVLVVQPSLTPQRVRQPDGDEYRWQVLRRLTFSAGPDRHDLVVWPETALSDLSSNAARGRVESLSQLLGAPLLTGASETLKFDGGEAGVKQVVHNAAYFVSSRRSAPPPYKKNILVPFAEYTPLDGIIPWPRWLVTGTLETTAGTEPGLFTLPGGISVGVIICWENLFSDYVRENVSRGASVIVQLVNDAWFGPTAAARQHNLASVLRAVENRRPVIVASNSGPSVVIDSYGRQVATLSDLYTEGLLSVGITSRTQRTVYNRFGDWFTGLALLLLAIPFVCRRRVGT